MSAFASWRRRRKGRQSYYQESRIGADSANPWICKSAEILGWIHKGEHEFLWELAMRPVVGHILEIGSWLGKSTSILAGACLERSDDSTVICVDTFTHDGSPRQAAYYRILRGRRSGTFYEFMANAKRLGFDKVILPIAVPSERARLVLAGVPLRMAFLDGQHDYEGVKTDIEMTLPLIVPGGVIALHDVDDRYPGIAQAVEDCLQGQSRIFPLGKVHCLVAYVVEGSR